MLPLKRIFMTILCQLYAKRPLTIFWIQFWQPPSPPPTFYQCNVKNFLMVNIFSRGPMIWLLFELRAIHALLRFAFICQRTNHYSLWLHNHIAALPTTWSPTYFSRSINKNQTKILEEPLFGRLHPYLMGVSNRPRSDWNLKWNLNN